MAARPGARAASGTSPIGRTSGGVRQHGVNLAVFGGQIVAGHGGTRSPRRYFARAAVRTRDVGSRSAGTRTARYCADLLKRPLALRIVQALVAQAALAALIRSHRGCGRLRVDHAGDVHRQRLKRPDGSRALRALRRADWTGGAGCGRRSGVEAAALAAASSRDARRQQIASQPPRPLLSRPAWIGLSGGASGRRAGAPVIVAQPGVQARHRAAPAAVGRGPAVA